MSFNTSPFSLGPAQIIYSSPSKTFTEGSDITLVCNVTGSEPLYVTWTRLDGPTYPQGSTKQFASINRSDEAVYQCTAHNGDECPVATSTNASIIVICKNTFISYRTKSYSLFYPT